MKIIISPAKKMQIDEELFDSTALPVFVNEASELGSYLKSCSPAELKAIWKCSDKLVEENADRIRLLEPEKGICAAIGSYEGIQYQYMSPATMEASELGYLDRHLRIVSGMYGLLRPFDRICPYRLEMQARLNIAGKNSLYAYWGSRICDRIIEEEDQEDRALIVNLASDEYSRAVLPYIGDRAECINISFLKETDKGLKKQSTLQKMARGEMVRYMAENNITEPKELKSFDRLGFGFCSEMSDGSNLTFIAGSGR